MVLELSKNTGDLIKQGLNADYKIPLVTGIIGDDLVTYLPIGTEQGKLKLLVPYLNPNTGVGFNAGDAHPLRLDLGVFDDVQIGLTHQSLRGVLSDPMLQAFDVASDLYGGEQNKFNVLALQGKYNYRWRFYEEYAGKYAVIGLRFSYLRGKMSGLVMNANKVSDIPNTIFSDIKVVGFVKYLVGDKNTSDQNELLLMDWLKDNGNMRKAVDDLIKVMHVGRYDLKARETGFM